MELFEVEVLFAEAGTEYWMPAQSQLLPYMDAELRAGSPVDVAAQLVAATPEDGWIFLMNEFLAVPE